MFDDQRMAIFLKRRQHWLRLGRCCLLIAGRFVPPGISFVFSVQISRTKAWESPCLSTPLRQSTDSLKKIKSFKTRVKSSILYMTSVIVWVFFFRSWWMNSDRNIDTYPKIFPSHHLMFPWRIHQRHSLWVELTLELLMSWLPVICFGGAVCCLFRCCCCGEKYLRRRRTVAATWPVTLKNCIVLVRVDVTLKWALDRWPWVIE